ncbi:DBH-like monooxygenase protein 2 homolog [Pollicipes pollicipes]|uniref:DBH-like monooxygenase protein 2 homolog n=1 Tax=Pollicipes pollicipes TaxID=41117 RepID=UPI001884A5B3|nr:DBH-like monooxygenase protein 2 homolog [Pollicipes pollicipes]
MFEVSARTDGWLGLGLSPTGTMAGADIVIGWVDDDNQQYFQDCWAAQNGRPSVDKKQNWQLHTARRNESHTMLRFRRDLFTGDPDDVYISGQPVHVIYAWRDTPPVSPDRLQYHGRQGRGVVTLCLLHPDCFPPASGAPPPVGTNLAPLVLLLLLQRWPDF